MKVLSIEHILELHALVVKETGGSRGIRDLGRLESAIATQTQNVFGEDLYPTYLEKAAALIRGIIGDHPFVDGNKRTAMLAGITLLKVNNITFKTESGDIEDFAVKIAVEKLNIKAIAGWLQERTQ